MGEALIGVSATSAHRWCRACQRHFTLTSSPRSRRAGVGTKEVMWLVGVKARTVQATVATRTRLVTVTALAKISGQRCPPRPVRARRNRGLGMVVVKTNAGIGILTADLTSDRDTDWVSARRLSPLRQWNEVRNWRGD